MPNHERHLEAVLELSARAGARTRGGLIEQVLRAALLLGEADGAVCLSPAGRLLERHVQLRSGTTPEGLEAPRGGTEFARLLNRAGRPVHSDDITLDGRLGPHDGCPGVEAGPALFVALRHRDQAPGYIAVYRRRGAAGFASETLTALSLLAAWAALAFENLRLSENVEKLAITDDLTQVYNYRFLKTALRREIKRAGRFRQELSLIMVDVDNLKAFNDRHGHLRGSHLLKEIASLLAAQLRSFDLVAKYGGDEFTLILPQTGREGALVVAERMRSAVAEHTFPLSARGSITVSLGVALYPVDGHDVTSLIQTADRALYVAKQRGRNRVESFGIQAA